MKLQIAIDGILYEADIEVLEDEDVGGVGAPALPAPRPAPRAATPKVVPSSPPPAAAAPAPSSAPEDKVVRSSIVGIVVKALVSPGQAVQAGEALLVLEAMKMESNVVAPVAGTIRAVNVAAGESVKKGQVLVEFA